MTRDLGTCEADTTTCGNCGGTATRRGNTWTCNNGCGWILSEPFAGGAAVLLAAVMFLSACVVGARRRGPGAQ